MGGEGEAEWAREPTGECVTQWSLRGVDDEDIYGGKVDLGGGLLGCCTVGLRPETERPVRYTGRARA
ncbi:hypothetical protein GUJ93_ZPchr0009g428 [Zizania palustris]|uniref:Uncharacterized protein n=1 Tax=Zizania palustris TaxID=103762 RepID=A0A8J5VNA2_ZIZPA|nr:hypothetical protein GUJ93_ZPchr0009g428 [Zizania palustris]